MPEESPFRFYPLLFLTDINVIRMDMRTMLGRQCRAIYLNLLFHSWIEGSLPDDEEHLKALSGNPKDWDKIWEIVGKCFKSKKGLLYNKRLEIERQKLIDWRTKSKRGGVKSGISRGEKPTKGGSRVVQPKPKGGSIPPDEKYAKYMPLVIRFHDMQSSRHPNDTCFKNREKVDIESAEVLERIVRINEMPFDELVELLDWILEDSWWSGNVRSLRSLRNKSKNGSMKFENACASMQASPENIESEHEQSHRDAVDAEQAERTRRYREEEEDAAKPEEIAGLVGGLADKLGGKE